MPENRVRRRKYSVTSEVGNRGATREDAESIDIKALNVDWCESDSEHEKKNFLVERGFHRGNSDGRLSHSGRGHGRSPSERHEPDPIRNARFESKRTDYFSTKPS